jgi:hypothetical protein
MKKNLIIVIIILAAAAGGYLLTQKDSDVSTNPEVSVSQTPTGKKMSFSSFLENDKGSYKCVVNQDVQGIESLGLVYISNGKVRGDFSTSVQGMSIDTSFIVKDGYSYAWNSLTKNGFKFKASGDKGQVNPGTSTSGTYSWNAEQIGDYDCQDWNEDSSVFALPTNITFSETK